MNTHCLINLIGIDYLTIRQELLKREDVVLAGLSEGEAVAHWFCVRASMPNKLGFECWLPLIDYKQLYASVSPFISWK